MGNAMLEGCRPMKQISTASFPTAKTHFHAARINSDFDAYV